MMTMIYDFRVASFAGKWQHCPPPTGSRNRVTSRPLHGGRRIHGNVKRRRSLSTDRRHVSRPHARGRYRQKLRGSCVCVCVCVLSAPPSAYYADWPAAYVCGLWTDDYRLSSERASWHDMGLDLSGNGSSRGVVGRGRGGRRPPTFLDWNSCKS